LNFESDYEYEYTTIVITTMITTANVITITICLDEDSFNELPSFCLLLSVPHSIRRLAKASDDSSCLNGAFSRFHLLFGNIVLLISFFSVTST